MVQGSKKFPKSIAFSWRYEQWMRQWDLRHNCTPEQLAIHKQYKAWVQHKHWKTWGRWPELADPYCRMTWLHRKAMH